MSGVKTEWEKQLPTELAFWDAVIGGTHSNKDWVSSFRGRARGEYEFPAHLKPLLPAGAAMVRILDVGAGPHSVIGLTGAPAWVEITAVDPLADEYARIMAKHGVTPRVPNTKGSAEDIASMFAADSFDLVYSRNALDHSFDPAAALEAMTKVCKPGGHIYLEGSINEGVNENYHGLHFWNFMPVDDDLVIWNKTSARSMGRMLGSRVRLDANARDGKWYQVTIKKLGA